MNSEQFLNSLSPQARRAFLDNAMLQLNPLHDTTQPGNLLPNNLNLPPPPLNNHLFNHISLMNSLLQSSLASAYGPPTSGSFQFVPHRNETSLPANATSSTSTAPLSLPPSNPQVSSLTTSQTTPTLLSSSLPTSSQPPTAKSKPSTSFTPTRRPRNFQPEIFPLPSRKTSSTQPRVMKPSSTRTSLPVSAPPSTRTIPHSSGSSHQATRSAPKHIQPTSSSTSSTSSSSLSSSIAVKKFAESKASSRKPSPFVIPKSKNIPTVSGKNPYEFAKKVDEIHIESLSTDDPPRYLLVTGTPNDSDLDLPLGVKMPTIIKSPIGPFIAYPGFTLRKLKLLSNNNHRTDVFEGDYKVRIMPKLSKVFDLSHEISHPEYTRITNPEHWFKFCATQVNTLLYDMGRPGDQTFIRNACQYFTNVIAKGRRDSPNIDISEKEALLNAGTEIVIFLSPGYGSVPCKTINNIELPLAMQEAINTLNVRMDFKCLRERFSECLSKISNLKEYQFYSLLANITAFFLGDYIVVSRNDNNIYSFRARFVDHHEPSFIYENSDELYETIMFYRSSDPHQKLIKKTLCTTISFQDYKLFRQLIGFYNFPQETNDPLVDKKLLQRYFHFLIKPEPYLNLEDSSFARFSQESTRKPAAI